MNVLIADDERQMVDILKAYFSKEGYSVTVAYDGEQALNQFYKGKFDLLILDWMMPKINGIAVCKEVKAVSEVQVIMLTAKSANDDELIALKAGADDYLRKPFDPRILITRAKRLVKAEASVQVEDLYIDFQGKKVQREQQELLLTRREFDLLEYFYRNRGKVLSRQQLIDGVWGLDYDGEERTVDTHIKRLRDKVGDERIKTHRGMGYSFELKK